MNVITRQVLPSLCCNLTGRYSTSAYQMSSLLTFLGCPQLNPHTEPTPTSTRCQCLLSTSSMWYHMTTQSTTKKCQHMVPRGQHWHISNTTVGDIPWTRNSELRNLFIQPFDYGISTKDKSNNYNVQNWGLGDICKDKKKSHWHRCHLKRL